jgi:hypothetical protein
MKTFIPLLSLALISFTTALLADTPADHETVVPPGETLIGKDLFTSKGCYQYHNAGETKLPKVELEPRLVIELGSEAHKAWTRDDYAKAIMNPQHVVAEDYRIAMMRVGDHVKAENSPMPESIDLLTLSDLIHLTTFLDSLTD